MKAHRILALAVAGLMSASTAWGARGGGGGHAAAPQHAAHVSAPHNTGTVHTNAPAIPARNRVTSHRRQDEFRHHRRAGDVVVGYPWWLYNNGYYGPYDNGDTYTPPHYNAPSNVGNGDASADQSVSPDFNAARSAMDAVASRQQAALLASPQWAQASGDFSLAQAELTAANDQMRTALVSNPEYRAAIEQKQAAQARAAALHEQGGASDAEIFAAAQDDLNASTTIARIERAAAANDPALVNARAHLQAAAAVRQALQNGLRAQVMNDPDWQAAKQQIASVK